MLWLSADLMHFAGEPTSRRMFAMTHIRGAFVAVGFFDVALILDQALSLWAAFHILP